VTGSQPRKPTLTPPPHTAGYGRWFPSSVARAHRAVAVRLLGPTFAEPPRLRTRRANAQGTAESGEVGPALLMAS